MHVRRSALILAIFLLVSVVASIAQQFSGTPFSADMVMTGGKRGDVATGKIYFDFPKWRMDMTAQGNEAIMIFDSANETAYMVMPSQKMYMEMNASNPMMGRGPKLPKAKPMNPTNPCADDQDMTCKKVGSETVNGRSTDKWEFTSKGKGDTYTAWVDQKLGFPVKSQSANGEGMELKNIQEGTQSAGLFQVPPGYRKFDFGQMMQGAPND